MNEVALVDEKKQLTASDVRSHVNLIQEVMRSVMKENTHYGIIPGSKKPTLYKAGSEVLLTTFRIAVDPEVTDLSTDDEICYRIKVIGTHQPTGTVIGSGIGECSSNEEKYKWREALCDEEYDAMPENQVRVKFKRKWNNQSSTSNIYQIKQIRTEPADLANTILKMAKKRAQVDLTLTATAASDIFTQDIEDLPEELRFNNNVLPEETISDERVVNLLALIEEVEVNKVNFLKFLKVENIKDLPVSKYARAVKELENKRK